MEKIKDAATEFLANRRVAVTGVSRNPHGHGSNIVYQRLRERGYEVFAVNPNADEVEGDACYHDLKSIPERRRRGRDRHPAGDRGGHDPRVRRARHHACVDAPILRDRKRLQGGCRLRPAARHQA